MGTTAFAFLPYCASTPNMRRTCIRFLLLAASLISLVGCASYVAPGAKADLQAFAPASIQEGFAAKATAPFPASIALARIFHEQ